MQNSATHRRKLGNINNLYCSKTFTKLIYLVTIFGCLYSEMDVIFITVLVNFKLRGTPVCAIKKDRGLHFHSLLIQDYPKKGTEYVKSAYAKDKDKLSAITALLPLA